MHTIFQNLVAIFISFMLGWAVCWGMNRQRVQSYYSEMMSALYQLDETEQLLEKVCRAATPVVGLINSVGDSEDWGNAAETSRRYEWHEIAPLADALKKVEKEHDEAI